MVKKKNRRDNERKASGSSVLNVRQRKRYCYFCKENIDHIDDKNVAMLRKFISDKGKIRPKRSTGNCSDSIPPLRWAGSMNPPTPGNSLRWRIAGGSQKTAGRRHIGRPDASETSSGSRRPGGSSNDYAAGIRITATISALRLRSAYARNTVRRTLAPLK